METRDELTIQCAIEMGDLNNIVSLVKRYRSGLMVASCCNILAYMMYESEARRKIIDAGIIPVMVEVLQTNDFDCQNEAIRAITYLAYYGTNEQITSVLSQENVIKALCSLLSETSFELLINMLKTILVILQIAQSDAPSIFAKVKDVIKKFNGLNALKEIQNSVPQANAFAEHIVNTYFTKETGGDIKEMDQDENAPPPQNEF